MKRNYTLKILGLRKEKKDYIKNVPSNEYQVGTLYEIGTSNGTVVHFVVSGGYWYRGYFKKYRAHYWYYLIIEAISNLQKMLVMAIYPLDSLDNVIDVKHRRKDQLLSRPTFGNTVSTMSACFFIYFLQYMPF